MFSVKKVLPFQTNTDEEGNPPLGSAGCVFNSRKAEAKKAAEVLNKGFGKYEKIILAGCGDYKRDVFDLLRPDLQSKVIQTSVCYKGVNGWHEAVQKMQDTIQLGPLLEQGELARSFLQDYSDPDRFIVIGMKQTLKALEMGAIEKLLLADPVPDIVPGLYIDDLEEHVIQLCEEQNTELFRITNFDGVTNMFHSFGGIGGYLRWYIPEDELDDDLLEEVEITNLDEIIGQVKPVAKVPKPKASDIIPAAYQNRTTSTQKRKNSSEINLFHGKQNVNLVFCGHVDAGKSTTVGHLLLQLGQFDEREFQNIQRLSERNGRASWSYAYIMDTREDEQAKGITVESAYASFETDKRRYTIIDSPGHRDYLTNMIEGASQGDIAVLMLSARATEFEDGFEGGQTKEHARLARAFGMKRVLMVVNKMDACNWNQDRYNQIVHVMKKFLKKELGFSSKSIQAVPISGVLGANLIEPLPKELCPWYDGLSLIGCLDLLKIKHSKKGELLMTVASRLKKGNRVVVHGRVDSGHVEVGQEVTILPSGLKALVVDVEIEEQSLKYLSQETGEVFHGYAGDQLQLVLANCEVDDISPGDIICLAGGEPQPTRRISAELSIQNLLKEQPFIMKGYQCVFHSHNLVVPCEISHVQSTILQEYGETGTVEITFSHEVAVSEYKLSKRLGSFVLRNEAVSVAVGRVLEAN
jgi:peptide chain release factor subunit 3